MMYSLFWATNAVTGIERAGYELCVSPHGSGIGDDNSSVFFNLARSRKLSIAGSWYRRLVLLPIGVAMPEG